MVEFDKVFFGYGNSSTIDDVSFRMEKGDFTALLGENGAGKSTLARLCNGLLKPSSGRVMVDGANTRETKTSVLARTIGYLFQNPDRQLCRNTVREEIMFGLEYAIPETGVRKGKVPAEAAALREARCEEMLRLFRLDGSRDPFGMSRGERQQVALSSVLARKPALLILDEPTTGLDYRECMTIMEIISRLNREGTTILMITHDMEVALDFARSALVLSKGRLLIRGPVREVMKDRALLSRASLLPAQIPALALILGEGYENVFTVDDMVNKAAGASL
ncbi:MAG: energy-coupling factor ABC transporter ATP-binding protein [Treponema sp.]|jgi:energy-coupling factor transport system ATP-binding protein|nr:energy-coupling factor ABC transporter ATP-binding protein [Treponema sp.]